MKPTGLFLMLYSMAFSSLSSGLSSSTEHINENNLIPARSEVAVSFTGKDVSKVKKALKDSKRSEDGRVVLFDSREQTLFNRGIVLRLRAFKDSEELTLKVRGPDRFPREERWKSWDTKCEQDLSPYSGRTSCSISREVDAGTLKKILEGRKQPNQVIPQEFWDFAMELTGHKLNNIIMTTTESAEISVWKYKKVEDLGGEDTKVVLEIWTLPNGTILPELSIKDELKLATNRLAELTDWLKKIKVQSVDLTPGKSEQILQFLR